MRQLASPNFNERPAEMAIDMIVLHAISLPPGQYDSEAIDDLFLGRLDCAAHPDFSELAGLRVSAHFLIDRRGGMTQYVSCGQRAWHAGQSIWQGRQNCNDFSVGIEIVGDEEEPFTAAQYRETARLCRALMRRFPAIERDRIVGHADIAPGRKWDPGRQWDWSRFRRSLARIRRLDFEFD